MIRLNSELFKPELHSSDFNLHIINISFDVINMDNTATSKLIYLGYTYRAWLHDWQGVRNSGIKIGSVVCFQIIRDTQTIIGSQVYNNNIAIRIR